MSPGLMTRIGAAAAMVAAACVAAAAQTVPPAGVPSDAASADRSQICVRLESQLATLDRGMADQTRGDQIRRYEEAAGKQQLELDRTIAQARRIGCEASGFFLFGSGPPQQCGDLNSQIQRMRSNLDRITVDLQRLQGGSVDRGEQRQGILGALAENNCGPQYRTAAAPPPPSGPRGFFQSLFGGGPSSPPPPPGTPNPDGLNPEIPQSSTFRTVCVRTCDGYFFPISFATVPSKFPDDERACQRMCPAAEVVLFSYRNPGEEVSQAVSLSGKRYTELPNAFRYRQQFDPACSCRRPGQSWAEALGASDATVERGDIIVTEDKAKALSQPPAPPSPQGKGDAAKSSKQTPRKGKPDPKAAATPAGAPPGDPAASEPPAADPSDKGKVRAVGPQFLPVR